MTIKECYDAFGGNYDEVISRLRTDERVEKFLLRVVDDGSYKLLCESIASGNADEAFRAAHTIKGVCMNLAITRLACSSSDLTEALRNNRTIDDSLQPLLDRVREDYEQTISSILQLKK